jgi:serine/threonine protein kinase
MSRKPDGLIGRQVAGHRLTALLGVGGMAKVYRAQDLELGREVAIKLVSGPQASDAAYVERFHNEAVRIAALTHPNIVPIYQYGEDHGALFLVMPVLAESLRERLDREHVLPFGQAVQIVTQIAAALQWAHSQGIVHRDVKPENILLDKTGAALLTDFGIAREVEALRQKGAKRTLSPSGLPVGTPEYMAPEQLQAHTVDHRADVYALGAVLYELITGTTPHAAATPYAVAVRVLTESLTPPTQHNPHIPPEMEQVVLRALAKSPEDRYQDMASFAEALATATSASHSTPVATTAFHVTTVPPGTLGPLASLSQLPTEPFEPLRRKRSATGIWQHSQFYSYRWLIASAVVALLLLSGAGLFLLTHLQPSPNVATHLITVQTATNTVPASSFNSPVPSTTTGVTSPERTATAQASATPRPVSTPTSGPGTPTPTSGPGTPTPTVTPISATSLHLSPATQIILSKQSHSCSGSQTITNHNPFPVSWQWTGTSPQVSNLQFQLTGSGWFPGLPFGTLSSNSSTTLSFTLDCSGGQSSAVSMSDDQGFSYSFSLLG